MPRVSRRSRMGGRRRRHRMKGGALPAWLVKAHDFIKRKKLISRVAGSLRSAGVPYAGTIGSVASKLGYGRRRKSGRGLRLAGGARRMRY